MSSPDDEVDSPPTTGMIEVTRRQNFRWLVRFGELIDNAFDAEANRIIFVFDRKTLTVEDDGQGCPDPLQMVTLGGRYKRASRAQTVGCYGIGLKDIAIAMADQIEIRTIHNGIRRSLSVDWPAMEKRGLWKYEKPAVEEVAGHGTTIILRQMTSGPPEERDKIIQELSLTYAPAIELGRQILIQWSAKSKLIPIPRFTFPRLEDDRTEEITIGNKKARVRIGLI